MHVRLPILVLLIASAASLSASEDADADAPHTDVRRQLLSEYSFVPHPNDVQDSSPVLSDVGLKSQFAVPETDNPYLYKMAPFTVRETVSTNLLHADFVQQKADAQRASIMNKLGIGVHVAPVGRAYFYAATIFHIPFAVGFGFSF
jgi:hypothetical protein